jgi:hypothetical protein
MQKVESSSLFSRFPRKPSKSEGFLVVSTAPSRVPPAPYNTSVQQTTSPLVPHDREGRSPAAQKQKGSGRPAIPPADIRDRERRQAAPQSSNPLATRLKPTSRTRKRLHDGAQALGRALPNHRAREPSPSTDARSTPADPRASTFPELLRRPTRAISQPGTDARPRIRVRPTRPVHQPPHPQFPVPGSRERHGDRTGCIRRVSAVGTELHLAETAALERINHRRRMHRKIARTARPVPSLWRR